MPTRDLSHLEELRRLLALERGEEEARFREQRERLTAQERVARGLALADLEAVDESFGLGGRMLVTFEHPTRQAVAETFEAGAVVEVTPRRAEVDEAVRAIVARRTRFALTLAFDEPPPEFVGAGRVWMELAPNDVTFRRAGAAISAAAAMDRGAARRRRDVLLGAEAPRFTEAAPRELGRPLNPEQQRAVERALTADDFFLVHGPPGTGKSTVLGEIAWQAARGGQRVLATAASNAAVDHLLALALERGLDALRVGHPARVAEHLHAHVLDVKVETHPDRVLARELFDEALELVGYARKQRSRGRSRERFSNARDAKREAGNLFKEARELERRAVRSLLSEARVVCATLTALGSRELEAASFDLVILDEATQATEPLSLLAFPKATRWILAGDHQQLPPTVLSQEAARQGLSRSLFERLLADHGEATRVMLREQYRMHEQIMRFPSREMYGGELRAHPSVAARHVGELAAVEDTAPLVFVDTAGKGFDEELVPGTDSYKNSGEASLAAARVRALVAAGVSPSAIACIAPYRGQVEALREQVGALDVEVDTVDAFQGREKDVVVLSLTRANADGAVGFLGDLRRMNVAMTRAKRQLWAIGDSATLAQHPFYARFIEEAQAQGGYRSAWELGE